MLTSLASLHSARGRSPGGDRDRSDCQRPHVDGL